MHNSGFFASYNTNAPSNSSPFRCKSWFGRGKFYLRKYIKFANFYPAQELLFGAIEHIKRAIVEFSSRSLEINIKLLTVE